MAEAKNTEQTKHLNYTSPAQQPVPVCPFCASRQVQKDGHRTWYCPECQALFNAQDIERERLRSLISLHLIGTSEEKPLIFRDDNIPTVGEEWPETVGLSSNDLLRVQALFLFQDGTMWYRPQGSVEWLDLDSLDNRDLANIAEALDGETPWGNDTAA